MPIKTHGPRPGDVVYWDEPEMPHNTWPAVVTFMFRGGDVEIDLRGGHGCPDNPGRVPFAGPDGKPGCAYWPPGPDNDAHPGPA